MNKQNLGLGFVVALLAIGAGALGGVTFSKPVVVQKIVEQVVTERLGASPGPVRTESCETRNGVEQCFTRVTMKQATTTTCAIRSPLNATSTLLRGNALFTTASSAASVIHMAKASTFNATTTSLGTYTILAGYQGYVEASTTPSGVTGAGAGADILDADYVFGPGQYFNVGVMHTGAGGMFVAGNLYVGYCQATFEVI